MLLSEFFDYLTYGNLSQYAVGTSDNGVIAAKDYPRLVSFLNLGLTRLHTALPLKLANLIVKVTPPVADYLLTSPYAVSSVSGEVPSNLRYILDQANPFLDNLLKIESITSDSDQEYTLNDQTDEETVFTPFYNKIQFNAPKDELVAITYRANHPLIKLSKSIDPTQITLDIPAYVLEPLLTYMTSRFLSGMATAEGIQEGAAYMQMFDLQVQSVLDAGLIQIDLPTNQRIWNDRWV